jgi:hypothetical protein
MLIPPSQQPLSNICKSPIHQSHRYSDTNDRKKKSDILDQIRIPDSLPGIPFPTKRFLQERRARTATSPTPLRGA